MEYTPYHQTFTPVTCANDKKNDHIHKYLCKGIFGGSIMERNHLRSDPTWAVFFGYLLLPSNAADRLQPQTA